MGRHTSLVAKILTKTETESNFKFHGMSRFDKGRMWLHVVGYLY